MLFKIYLANDVWIRGKASKPVTILKGEKSGICLFMNVCDATRVQSRRLSNFEDNCRFALRPCQFEVGDQLEVRSKLTSTPSSSVLRKWTKLLWNSKKNSTTTWRWGGMLLFALKLGTAESHVRHGVRHKLGFGLIVCTIVCWHSAMNDVHCICALL